jgi:hypothetical protein
MTNSPFTNIPNKTLFLQTFAVLELLQHRDPNPERADILQRLRPVHNYLIHGSDLSPEDLNAALTDVLEYLHRLEMTSLGTPKAQRVRQRAEPGVIVEALRRSSEGPSIGAHYTNNPGCKGASMTENYINIWTGDYHLNCDCCGRPVMREIMGREVAKRAGSNRDD